MLMLDSRIGYYDLAKQLSHHLYFFSFLFLLDLLHRKECGKVSHDRKSQHHMMGIEKQCIDHVVVV